MGKRLRRIGFLGLCIFTYLTRGRANKIPQKISKVVVVLTGKLGDLVCGTPVLRALRIYLPQAHIIVAGGTKLQRAVLSDSGLVDEYLDLDGEGAISRLKKTGADAALVTGPSYEPAAMAYVAGIPLVVAARVVGGFSPSETRPYKILKRFIMTFPYQIGAYAPRERLKVLEPLGIFSKDTKKHLGFSEAADTKVKKFFSDNSIDIVKDFVVAISPSAGNKIKEWPEEKFAEVADYIAKKYHALIVIIGGPSDKEKVERTARHLSPETKHISVVDFTIDELKSFVSNIHLFISVDTGPIYIAEAFGIPKIDITGPIDEHEQPPIGPKHKVVVPPGDRKPELFVLNSKSYNYDEAMRQIDSITPLHVEEAIDSLMIQIKK